MFSLSEFADTYRNDSTVANVKISVSRFLEMVYSLDPPDKRGADWYEQMDPLSEQYLQEKHDHIKEIVRYVKTSQHRAPKTLNRDVLFIRLWLEVNDIEIKRSKLRLLRSVLPPSRAISEEDELPGETIKQIMSHCRQPLRSIVLVLLSSGMRIGELLELPIEDIDLGSDPVVVKVASKKSRAQTVRFSFISSEARLEVVEWLKIRDDYMITARKKYHGSEPWETCRTDLLFPFSPVTVRQMFYTACRKAGVARADAKTRRATIHLHMFRKFFISQLKAAGMPAEMVEMMAGHEGYLDGAYRRFPQAQVAEEYRKAEYAISLAAPDMQVRADLQSQGDMLKAVMSDSARLRAELERQKVLIDQISFANEIIRLANDKGGSE